MSRRPAPKPVRLPPGGVVVLVGLFSAKDRSADTTMDALAASVQAHGARVAARVVQRRGVSHGGVRSMSLPFSRRTLISGGKAQEVADACGTAGADAVVFANPLTAHQRDVLAAMTGRPVLDAGDLHPPG